MKNTVMAERIIIFFVLVIFFEIIITTNIATKAIISNIKNVGIKIILLPYDLQKSAIKTSADSIALFIRLNVAAYNL